MSPAIDRRSFLLGGASAAAIAAGSPLPSYSQDIISAAQFAALSARLTGVAAAGLDAAMAQRLREAFIAAGQGSALARLAAASDADNAALANDLVAAWYSGVCVTPAGPVVAGFTQALLWNALDFTKPFASCGGATGYWADPPRS